jgi:hypothetical protein
MTPSNVSRARGCETTGGLIVNTRVSTQRGARGTMSSTIVRSRPWLRDVSPERVGRVKVGRPAVLFGRRPRLSGGGRMTRPRSDRRCVAPTVEGPEPLSELLTWKSGSGARARVQPHAPDALHAWRFAVLLKAAYRIEVLSTHTKGRDTHGRGHDSLRSRGTIRRPASRLSSIHSRPAAAAATCGTIRPAAGAALEG